MTSKHVRFKDEVEALTPGECLDHSRFPVWWGVVRETSGYWRVWDYDKREYVGEGAAMRGNAIRKALATALDDRSQPQAGG